MLVTEQTDRQIMLDSIRFSTKFETNRKLQVKKSFCWYRFLNDAKMFLNEFLNTEIG